MQSDQKIFLKARWQNLAMINYEVDPTVLLPYLPPHTELDFFNGKALVSVVGFQFNHTRVLGIQWPFHTNFEEVNLRFYVKHFDGQMYKRGVVFISEIVPRFLISTMANVLYNEHYACMSMKHEISLNDQKLTVRYEWKNKQQWNKMEVEAGSAPNPIKGGSEEEFILEHYWGYSQYDKNTTIEYGVEHERWQVYKVENWSLNCDVEGLYGKNFVPFLSKAPSSVYLAKGSDVIIRKPRFIKKQMLPILEEYIA